MSVLASSSVESFFQLLGVLVIFLFVLVITFYITKWMGGIQKGRITGKNIRVVETIAIGNNKMICLVEAGTKYLVVALGKDNVNLLTELSREELKDVSFLEDADSDRGSESFQAILMKIKDNLPKKQE